MLLQSVLILVLMEYALEVSLIKNIPSADSSLNPCSNGICSRRQQQAAANVAERRMS